MTDSERERLARLMDRAAQKSVFLYRRSDYAAIAALLRTPETVQPERPQVDADAAWKNYQECARDDGPGCVSGVILLRAAVRAEYRALRAEEGE